MNRKDKVTNHESFGQISLSKVQGGAADLYGSSIKHQSKIVIRISESELHRNLNYDRHHPGKRIIEVQMSNSQFTEFIMSGNMYEGVPCTIKYRDGKVIEYPSIENKIEQFQNEFSDSLNDIVKTCRENEKRLAELLSKKSLNKKDKEELQMMMRMTTQEIESNIPFVYEMFNEQMDKSVIEAKGEVEAFVENKVRSLGLESAGQELLPDRKNIKRMNENRQV